jgi:hypothetical protein
MVDLVISNNKIPGLYGRMQDAIAQCYDMDDCKVIAEQANAIAAYFKQINDDDSMRKFLAVKMRSWRRIGEICATMDRSDCLTQQAYAEKIQKTFPQLRHDQISQALRVAQLPKDFFDRIVSEQKNLTALKSMQGMMSAYNMEIRENTPEAEQRRKTDAEERTARKEKDAQAREEGKPRDIGDVMSELIDSHNVAYGEVGYTMDRRDRRNMKSVVLLLKEPIHSILRQAAFDHRLTMQEIIRQGLVTWLNSNNYKVE